MSDETNLFYLPIGLKHNGKDITEVEIADTGGEAEKVFTTKPSSSKKYTWFGEILSVAIDNIGGEPIASEFIAQGKDKEVMSLVKKIPFVDAGSLLLQVQRSCWERTIANQKITCVNCDEKLEAEVDLNLIDVPQRSSAVDEFLIIHLPKTYAIENQIEQLKDYEGYRYNALKVRIPTLGDAIRHQKVSKDDVLFWRNIAFDCIEGFLLFDDKKENVLDTVPDGWLNKRGKLLFTKDFNTPTLRQIRASLQKDLPSAKFYYEEDCPVCGEPTPFFASVGHFFAT